MTEEEEEEEEEEGGQRVSQRRLGTCRRGDDQRAFHTLTLDGNRMMVGSPTVIATKKQTSANVIPTTKAVTLCVIDISRKERYFEAKVSGSGSASGMPRLALALEAIALV